MIKYTWDDFVKDLRRGIWVELFYKGICYNTYTTNDKCAIIRRVDRQTQEFSDVEDLIEHGMIEGLLLKETFDDLRSWFAPMSEEEWALVPAMTWREFEHDVLHNFEFDLTYNGKKYGISNDRCGSYLAPYEEGEEVQTFASPQELLAHGRIEGMTIQEVFDVLDELHPY